MVLVGPAAGFLAPDLWLARRARARAQRARRELPAMLDLLRVTVEAGGSLAASLGAVGERGGGALAVEWRAVAREVTLGVGLSEALAAMTERLPQPEIQALVSALERARRHGAPLAETLEAQARDARFALRRAVQEDAAKAGPKIQLVVALMLVPSVLLLVAAALAAALLGGRRLAAGGALAASEPAIRVAAASAARKLPCTTRNARGSHPVVQHRLDDAASSVLGARIETMEIGRSEELHAQPPKRVRPSRTLKRATRCSPLWQELAISS